MIVLYHWRVDVYINVMIYEQLQIFLVLVKTSLVFKLNILIMFEIENKAVCYSPPSA